jgi:hypothetical protein
MTNSACTARADTAAGDTGIVAQVDKKPPRTRRTIAITDEAYTTVTRLAGEERTDRKSVASEAILAYSANQSVKEGLPRLKAKSLSAAELYLDQIIKDLEAGTLKVSAAGFERFTRGVQRMVTMVESESSVDESAFAEWRMKET